MSLNQFHLSSDQADAYDTAAQLLKSAGVDLDNDLLVPPKDSKKAVMALVGKAGSGKTLLLAKLYEALSQAGVDIILGDYEESGGATNVVLQFLLPQIKLRAFCECGVFQPRLSTEFSTRRSMIRNMRKLLSGWQDRLINLPSRG